MNWGEAYYNHFEKFFGSPSKRKIYRSGKNPAIQLLFFDDAVDNCLTFCTIGLTHYQKELNGIAEVFVPVQQGWKEVPEILVKLLFSAIEHSIPLRHGTVLSGIEEIMPRFTQNYEKSALHFKSINLAPGFEAVHRDTDDGLEHGRLYFGTFISKAEQKYLKEFGEDSFNALLTREKPSVTNLFRPSCI